MSGTKSISVSVNQDTDKVLELLKEKTGATSKADVIRKAIALLQEAAKSERITLTQDGENVRILL